MPERSLFSRLTDNRVTRPIKRSIIKHVAARAPSRGLLNRYYNLLSDRQRSTFQSRYAYIFYGHHGAFTSGLWRVEFVGRNSLFPFAQDRCWLDWAVAVGLVAHDMEVKETYRALIQSESPPVLFLDVGANYGMHSLLFLAVGIPIIAFEPNPTCLAYFQDICELNGLAGRWEGVAIGRSAGELELVYPEHQPWLGSTQPSQHSSLTGHQNIKRCTVAVKTLDSFFDSIPERGLVMVKIDVEGSEPDVLIGGHGCSRVMMCV